MQYYFITATDTDAGKTYYARLLTQALVKKNKKVAVYKPIAAGCEKLPDNTLVNEDALLLQQASNCGQTYSAVNPISFEPAIAPHIAANELNQPINEQAIKKGYQALSGEINIIEGAGGWRLPLGNGNYLSELVQWMNADVILVVNMKLGCLNHAVLTYQSIINDGLTCTGWVANCQSDMPYLEQNITELKSLLPIPCLNILPHQPADNLALPLINTDFISPLPISHTL